MAETLAPTFVPEVVAEPELASQELGSLPVAVSCVFSTGCTQAGGCPTTCAGEFTRQPDPLAVLEASIEPGISVGIPQ